MKKTSRRWMAVILIAVVSGLLLACSFSTQVTQLVATPTPDIMATVQAIQAGPTPLYDQTELETTDLVIGTVQEGEGLTDAIERSCNCSMDSFINFGLLWHSQKTGQDYYIRSSYSRIFENPHVSIPFPYVWPGDTIRLDETWAVQNFVSANADTLNLVTIVYTWEGGERITLVGGEFAPQTIYRPNDQGEWVVCDIYSRCYPYLQFNALMEQGLTSQEAFGQLP